MRCWITANCHAFTKPQPCRGGAVGAIVLFICIVRKQFWYFGVNKSSGSMAKRRQCAVKTTDTKKLQRDLKAKKSGVKLRVKKENTGMEVPSRIRRFLVYNLPRLGYGV